MRMIMAWSGMMLIGAALEASPDLVDKSEAAPLPHLEAQNYAQQLNHMLSMITSQYVRPVERGDLVAAALKGLFESARQSVPASLLDDARTAQNEDELLAVLIRARSRLGDCEALRGPLALQGSLKALTDVLDPYSGVVSGAEWNHGQLGDHGASIGLEIKDHLGVGPLVIKTVVPGGPAQRAGLRPGDLISHIDGRSVEGQVNLPARLQARRVNFVPAPQGMIPFRAEFTVHRPGQKEARKVTLEEQVLRPETVLGCMRQDDNSWNYFVDRQTKIAHVRIATLDNGTARELEEVMAALQGQGVRGLILDLRWCPGGFLNEAVNIAQFFVGESKVASVKSRDGRQVDYGVATKRRRKNAGLPMLVLVNGETSGGAELIAAAIQDNRRGIVAGQRTLGKASVQTPIDLPIPNLKFKLTSGTFHRPSGKNLHRFTDSKPADDWGVRPDLEFRVSPDLSRKLRDWWQLHTLRPGGTREVLPLDDPAADPQRQSAVETLLDTVTKLGEARR